MVINLLNKTVVLLCLAIPVQSQDLDLVEELLGQVPDGLERSTDESHSVNQYLLEEIKAIDLNRASFAQLSTIPWLTPIQVQSLIKYIEQNGSLVSIYELQAVPGWDLGTIRLIEPMVQVSEIGAYHDPRNRLEMIQQDGGVELIFRVKRRLELSRGYNRIGAQAFLGSPIYMLSRIRYRKKGDLSFGITAEKDSGERFLWNPSTRNYGPDHLSMHLLIENRGFIKRLILGDFQASWDQGLVVNSGLNLGNQVITSPRKVHRGLLPHTGTREYGFYRGIGMEVRLGNTTISTLYSRRSLDARLLSEDSVSGLPKRVPSIIKSGLHRTLSEVNSRNQLPEQTLGIHLRQDHSRHLNYSLSAVYRYWKWPLVPKSNRYNTFQFKGKHNYNLSGSVEYVWENINIFGQFAISASGGWGGLIGLITSFSPDVSMTLHLRNYQRNFHGISGNAFGIRNGNRNEQGIYWGFQVVPSSRWVVGVSANFYNLPGLTRNTDTKTFGINQLIRCQYVPNKKSHINLFWRIRSRQINEQNQAKSTHSLIDEIKHTLGISAKWQGEENIILQSRVQYSQVLLNSITTQGILASNQVSFDLDFIKMTLSMAIFNTDDFENRQFKYERDLPYSLSIPFFDGLGTRWYCLTRLRISNQVDFWLRIAQTYYRDRDQVGSGLDTIEGSKRTDISLQLRYKL